MTWEQPASHMQRTQRHTYSPSCLGVEQVWRARNARSTQHSLPLPANRLPAPSWTPPPPGHGPARCPGSIVEAGSPPARRRLRALTAYPGPLEWPGRGRGPGRPPARTAVQCVGRQARPGPARPQTGAQRPPQPRPGQALTCRRRRCHPGGVTGASRGRRRAEEAALGRTAQPPLRLSPSSSGPSSNRKYLAGNTAARRGTGRGQHLSRPRRACLWSFTRHAVAGATAGGNRLKWWKKTVNWSFRPKATSFGGGEEEITWIFNVVTVEGTTGQKQFLELLGALRASWWLLTVVS